MTGSSTPTRCGRRRPRSPRVWSSVVRDHVGLEVDGRRSPSSGPGPAPAAGASEPHRSTWTIVFATGPHDGDVSEVDLAWSFTSPTDAGGAVRPRRSGRRPAGRRRHGVDLARRRGDRPIVLRHRHRPRPPRPRPSALPGGPHLRRGGRLGDPCHHVAGGQARHRVHRRPRDEPGPRLLRRSSRSRRTGSSRRSPSPSSPPRCWPSAGRATASDPGSPPSSGSCTAWGSPAAWASLGLATTHRVGALAAFNVGIDVAQTAVVLLVTGAMWVSSKALADHQGWIRTAVCGAAAALGLAWTVSRLAL